MSAASTWSDLQEALSTNDPSRKDDARLLGRRSMS